MRGRKVQPCSLPNCGKLDDVDNCELCRTRVMKRNAERARKAKMKLNGGNADRPQIPEQVSKKECRFNSEVRNLTNLSGGKFERAFDRIVQRW